MSDRGPPKDQVPMSAISSNADLRLDLAQHGLFSPGCSCCGYEPSRIADNGQLCCKLFRCCYVDVLPQTNE